MHGMRNGFTGLRIREVSMEKDEPVVILEDRASGRRFRIPVGPFEATAIILELESIPSPRPLTHDLLADFFRGGRVQPRRGRAVRRAGRARAGAPLLP